METKITTTKTGAGHFKVGVIHNRKFMGEFETTDMQLIDDVHEMNSDGFEDELMMFDSFEDVETHCIKQMNMAREKKNYPYGRETYNEHYTRYDGTQIR